MVGLHDELEVFLVCHKVRRVLKDFRWKRYYDLLGNPWAQKQTKNCLLSRCICFRVARRTTQYKIKNKCTLQRCFHSSTAAVYLRHCSHRRFSFWGLCRAHYITTKPLWIWVVTHSCCNKSETVSQVDKLSGQKVYITRLVTPPV